MDLPRVRDAFQVGIGMLQKWQIEASYQDDREAYWNIQGLHFMPWANMPREEGRAVCFSAGGSSRGNYADAILFHNGKWHHIRRYQI